MLGVVWYTKPFIGVVHHVLQLRGVLLYMDRKIEHFNR